MLTESQLKSDFDRMEYVVLQEIERDVREGHPHFVLFECRCDTPSGILHTGHAAVIQCLAVKSQ